MVLEIPIETKPKLTRNAIRVLEKRYLRRNRLGEIVETPGDMFRRVAKAVASAELLYDPKVNVEAIEADFYRMMTSLEFLPNSPTLLNAGTEDGQLSSCFVLPVPDSVEETFDAVKYTALIHKSGGGIGFNLSQIRPRGSSIRDRLDVAGGPVALTHVLSSAAGYIRQGGIRQGCNAVVLPVNHPDILDFIASKSDPETLVNFYNSIAVTDDFMAKVKADVDYPLLDPIIGKVVRCLSAREVFNRIVDQAWLTGDPGLAFIDSINRDNPTPSLGTLSAITGCGEQALLPYESTNLGSINLALMLTDRGDGVEIDFNKLRRVVSLAIRFLDDVIDVNRFPIKKIETTTKRTRKIGLGVMGFADLLLRLSIPYNSTKAINVAESVMKFITDTAHETSRELAEKRGVFPAWEDSIYSRECIPMRNARCTTIAPTGTLSIIAGVSSGIEPIFASIFVRNILEGENLLEINPHFERVAKEQGFFTQELLEQLVASNHLHERTEVPEDIKRIFVTAHEVSPEWHVRIQAAFQRQTDNAVSKTVNFPHDATREDISRVFMMAFEQRLKGITVYRDKSRDLQPLCICATGVNLVRKLFEND